MIDRQLKNALECAGHLQRAGKPTKLEQPGPVAGGTLAVAKRHHVARHVGKVRALSRDGRSTSDAVKLAVTLDHERSRVTAPGDTIRSGRHQRGRAVRERQAGSSKRGVGDDRLGQRQAQGVAAALADEGQRLLHWDTEAASLFWHQRERQAASLDR